MFVIIMDAIDSVKTYLNTHLSAARMAQIDAINTNTARIDANTARGGVKSVQRGTTSGPQTINISGVNPAKCDVSLLGGGGGGYININQPSVIPVQLPYVTGLTSTALSTSALQSYTNSISGSASLSYSWQVVEYY